MKNMKLVKGMGKDWTPDQKQRATDITTQLKPIYKKINAEHLCNLENIHRILGVSRDIAQVNLNITNRFAENELLRKFNTTTKWYLLHKVVRASASGEMIYKEKLLKDPHIKVSATTLYKEIDELMAEGLFINMAQHSPKAGKKDFRAVNLRPSVPLTVAYLSANVDYLVDTMDFLREYTKIRIEFS